MVQNTAKRGRPPKFDRDAVISAAVGAFFSSGYESTSLPDLEKATGVDRSTLYNSFGGKQGLYELATTNYLDIAERSLFGPLHEDNTDGYTAILDLLDRIRSGLTGPEISPGCLIVNDMAAGSAPEAAARYRSLLEDGLLAALGRTSHPSAEAGAATLATSILGVNLVSKLTGDPAEVDRLIDGAVATVKDWQDNA